MTNGSAEPSAWKKMDVSSDIKAGSLPRTGILEMKTFAVKFLPHL